MTQPLILIIDDEPDIRELLEITFARMNIDCESVPDLNTAKQMLEKNQFDLCLTDMKLPDGDGVNFVEYSQNEFPDMPIAVITAHGSMETAIQAMKNGAFDFLTKPVDLEQLRILVKNALQLKTQSKQKLHFLVGDSEAINRTREIIAKLSRSQAPVYISGESGTGKELVARMIHEQGPRASKPFVPVNCGAIPHDLMESEFFGHLKGSFTGAISDKEGFFQAANNGTLFLDEIAELPEHMQVKLLRSIQEKTIRSVGSQNEQPINVRILCATHKNLTNLVRQEKFRQDLYYRLNVIDIHVPALRERRNDIPLLVNHILKKITNKSEEKDLPLISEDAMRKINEYDYPGNVRELENILERAFTLSNGRKITADLLQLKNGIYEDSLKHQDTNLGSYMENVEKQKIIDALEKTRWNKTAAAKLLGISFRALRYRLEKLGLN